jgi:hypothetical protein
MRRNFRIIYSWIATGVLTVGLGTGVLAAMPNGPVGSLSSSTVAVHQSAPVVAQSSAATTSWAETTSGD